MAINKPMLAVDAQDLSKLKYPLLASPKLDGIRCLKVGGQALSRKFKAIPNTYIREWIEANLPDGVDGELMAGDNFQQAQSSVMKVAGKPEFKYMLFDYVTDVSIPFRERFNSLTKLLGHSAAWKHVELVPHILCENEADLVKFEQWCVNAGYEGTMVRSVDGGYKNGRSTLREGLLLKIKRWADSEAVVLDVREQFTNTNEKKVDELGHSKRSSHQNGMVAANTLGEFYVRDVVSQLEFSVGTGEGLTKELRQAIWNDRGSYVGRLITYKYVPFGVKELPRFPIFKGFRSPDDMGE